MTIKNPTDMVRQFAAAQSIVRRAQLRKQLDLSASQVDEAICNLRQGKWLERIGHGIYEFRDRPASDRPSPINDRLWRAMRVNPKFSAAEIARQAGTTRNYANKVLRQYLRAGFVRRLGQRTNDTGSHETAWMLTKKGRQYIERPTVKKFVPDPIVVKVVKLNQLVCTGLAMQNPEDNNQAASLCQELIESLEKVFGK